jgi:hypothetical protein
MSIDSNIILVAILLLYEVLYKSLFNVKND